MENLPQQNSTIMDAIRDKIKGSFVELIPDTNWDAMVKAEVDAFFTQPCEFTIETTRGGYGSPDKKQFKFEGNQPTMFKTLVWDLCIEETRKYLDGEHVQKLMKQGLQDNEEDVENKTADIIKEAIPMMIQSYFENIARGMTNDLAMRIQESLNNNFRAY